MYGSQSASKDLDLSFPVNFKNTKEIFHEGRDATDSDLHLQLQEHHQQLNSSLLRFRSARGSLLSNFIPSTEDFISPRSSSPETESLLTRFMSCDNDSGARDAREIGEKSMSESANNPQKSSQFNSTNRHDAPQNGFSHSPRIIYQIQSQPNRSSSPAVISSESSYREDSTSSCSNLIRHSSSPAGLFANLNVENCYGSMRGLNGFRSGNASSVEARGTELQNQSSFSSRQGSTGHMSRTSQIENGSSPDDGNGRNHSCIPGFPITSWEDSSLVSEKFSTLKRSREVNGKILSDENQSDNRSVEMRNHTPTLTHQLSLPKTASDMGAIEKFLQFHDSVPFKIRAKRGCATHPRSIAERVRRTKISEKMRKLQELVPNMDKQTNTADMLDFAVEYIKDLQNQVKKLSDSRASCTCSCRETVPVKQKEQNIFTQGK